MRNAYFITGTDTDCGKTTMSVAWLAAARAQGLQTLGLKPLASGCQQTADGLRNPDALALIEQSSIQLPYQDVNPFAFAPAVAPHAAAAQAGVSLDVDGLLQGCAAALKQQPDLLLVEGAGGWYVPLNSKQTLADFACALGLPVVLVVGVRLGCINHALLTARAITSDGLQLAGWIANCIEPDMPQMQDTLLSLQQHLTAPCLAQVPWTQQADTERLAQHFAQSIQC